MFYINPLREEVVHLKPRIVVYHNMMSDEEIEKMKELSIPKVSDITSRLHIIIMYPVLYYYENHGILLIYHDLYNM